MDRTAAHLVQEWAKVTSAEGDVDYKKARWAAEAMAYVSAKPGRPSFSEFCHKALDLPSMAVKALMLRAQALRLVPDERVWRAAGWKGGVKKIMRVTDDAVRARVCEVIVAEYAGGKKYLTPGRVTAILREHALDCFCPPCPKRKNKALAAAEAQIELLKAQVAQLKGVIKTMVKQAPILATTLSDEQRDLVGLPATPVLV